jgi:drug/metabolite transporter (DMT)-like permease
MTNAIFGFISLILAAMCSLMMFIAAAGGTAYPPYWVKSLAISLIVFVLLTIFFFYRHFRGHPEHHLFDPKGD